MTAQQKKALPPPPHLLLAQEEQVQQLITRFEAQVPSGLLVQQLEGLLRTAIFKPANALVGDLL